MKHQPVRQGETTTTPRTPWPTLCNKCVGSPSVGPVIVVLMLVVLFNRYLDAIERAVANGDCVLIENMGENMDPVLDPLVGRNTIKKGRYVAL